MADVTFVRLLPRVNSKVSLQFEGVWAGVGAVDALVRSLTSVATHVSLQLT